MAGFGIALAHADRWACAAHGRAPPLGRGRVDDVVDLAIAADLVPGARPAAISPQRERPLTG